MATSWACCAARSPISPGHLDRRPDVELVHDEARSYAARTGERFDVIQASLVDTWAAAANGAYVLSENALYTQEAFRIFLDRLTPDGVLSVSRWYFDAQPGETLRLLSLASTVLRQRGVARVQDHLFLVRSTRPVRFRGHAAGEPAPVHRGRRRALAAVVRGQGVRRAAGPRYQQQRDVGDSWLARQEPSALVGDVSDRSASAPTDDRPFFFNMLRLRDAFWANLTRRRMRCARTRARW